MARPKSQHPTPAELDVLKVVWDSGPCLVREVLEALNAQGLKLAYTTVMTRMNVMADKGLLRRKQRGRAFVYEAKRTRQRTSQGIVGDLLKRVFNGKADALMSQLLDEAEPTSEELDAIRRTIDEYRSQRGESK